MSHCDNCMRAISEAAAKGKYSPTLAGAIYDKYKQEEIQEAALRGVSGIEVNESLSKFDRDLMHQVLDNMNSGEGGSFKPWVRTQNWGSNYISNNNNANYHYAG